MASLRVICEKCKSVAVVVTFKGTMPMKVDDPPAYAVLTIRCPQCGERKQTGPLGNENSAAAKRAYLSH